MRVECFSVYKHIFVQGLLQEIIVRLWAWKNKALSFFSNFKKHVATTSLGSWGSVRQGLRVWPPPGTQL